MRIKQKLLKSLFFAVIISIVALLLTFSLLWVDNQNLALLTGVPILIIIVYLISNIVVAKRNVHKYIVSLCDDISRLEMETFYLFPEPAIVLDSDGYIIWYNAAFNEKITDGEEVFGEKLEEVCHINLYQLNTDMTTTITAGENIYKLSKMDSSTNLSVVSFNNITNYRNLLDDYNRTRPVVMIVIIDNYEDLLQNAKETEKAHISAAIEQLLEDFVTDTGSILKRLNRDRFIVIANREILDKIIEEEFPIIEKAHNITVGERMFITLSIGIGYNAGTYEECETAAKQSLDMALGRGGDQVAIKTEDGFQFFGGLSQTVEKKSRSRARIITNALQELLQNCEKVFIMGHANSDLDSIGAAVGLAGAIRLGEKQVNIVVERKTSLANILIEATIKNYEYKELFINVDTALDNLNSKTLLIIVDVHNKDILESRELYEKAKTVVVIDHHRKVVNHIDNAVIFHHEPFASSASEMVTEIIQYLDNASRLPNCCADALLAGITLDTKNFVMRTGSRTFEAAAYLRKIGADTIVVKKMFSSTIENYKKRTALVSSAEIHDRYAVCVIPDNVEEIRLIAPQVADELLDVRGIEASFVVFKVSDGICISARSMSGVNVQLIMEKLGGGGHQNMAAAKLKGVTVSEAKSKLLEVLHPNGRS